MAFCKNCGKPVSEGTKFCANCGTPVEAQPAVQTEPVQYSSPAVSDDMDAASNKGMGVLAYLGIFLLIPLFSRRKSEFCRFHVTQGFTLACLSIVYSIVTSIIKFIVGLIFPGETYNFYGIVYREPSVLYNIVSAVFGLASIFFLVMAIMGIVNAAKGEKKELPILGQIKILHPVVDKIYAALNK